MLVPVFSKKLSVKYSSQFLDFLVREFPVFQLQVELLKTGGRPLIIKYTELSHPPVEPLQIYFERELTSFYRTLC